MLGFAPLASIPLASTFNLAFSAEQGFSRTFTLIGKPYRFHLVGKPVHYRITGKPGRFTQRGRP